MQHLGSEDQMQQALRDFLTTLSPEERLEGLSSKERLKGLPPEERLEGLSPEQRLEGLSPEELERLRQLLQTPAKADDSSRPA
jgi:hypothetical protein